MARSRRRPGGVARGARSPARLGEAGRRMLLMGRAVATSPAAVVIADAGGRVTWANDVFLRMWGYESAAQVAGRPASDFAADPDVPRRDFELFRTGHPASGLAVALRRDGSTFPVERVVSMATDPEGRPIGILGQFLDVTARVEAVRRLGESEARYRRLHRSMRDAFAAADMEGRIVEANRAYCEMLGYAEEELLGLRYADLTPSAWHEIEARIVAEQVLPRGYSDVYEKEYVRKDGSVLPVEVRTFLVRDEAGRPVSMWAIVRDIAERKRTAKALAETQATLQRAQKLDALGRLAGGIAHDFNNMLVVVLSLASALERRLASDPETLALVRDISRAGERASELTRQLLAFARRQPAEPRVLDVAERIESFSPLLRQALGEHVELVVETPPDLWPIRVDPSQLEQVLLNLTVNARDAMPDGGRLVVRASNQDAAAPSSAVGGPCLHLEVRDEGIGMAPETVARLFEPFFTTKEAGRGTGLGLATVHGIVAQAGGTISVESAPGRGSTFHVLFPSAAGYRPERVDGVPDGARGPARPS